MENWKIISIIFEKIRRERIKYNSQDTIANFEI